MQVLQFQLRTYVLVSEISAAIRYCSCYLPGMCLAGSQQRPLNADVYVQSHG